MNNKRAFSKILKQLRTEKNMSILQLAKELNISNATICRWENGTNDIKSDQLIVVAEYFNVSTDYLLDLED